MKLPFSRTFNEKPILFNTEMVKAILEGRKTQTRRVVKPQPGFTYCTKCKKEFTHCACYFDSDKKAERCTKTGSADLNKCPYGKPGDRLWVRETWALTQYDFDHIPDERIYRADFGNEPVDWNWKPSIFMPREVSRILLEITDIRVERVQQILNVDALAEGIQAFSKDGNLYKYGLDEWKWSDMPRDARDAFKRLWDSINKKRGFGWEVNPWVWVVEFKRIEMPLSEQQQLSQMQQDCFDNCEI
jgi:hypothetical protein